MRQKPICQVDDNGDVSWMLDGVRHRTDGPARICKDGTECWYVDGLLHRTGGPAVYGPNGERWCQRGLRHRADGPAYISNDGTQIWYYRDQCHRTDGPAVVRTDGHVEWYLNGTRMTSASRFQHRTNATDEYIAMLILKYGAIK